MGSSQSRTDRSRQAAADDAIAALDREDARRPGSFVGQTTTTGSYSYPTTAGVYYAIQPIDVGAKECEGCTPTLVASGQVIYAANVGTNVPPMGTYLVVTPVGSGRSAFRY